MSTPSSIQGAFAEFGHLPDDAVFTDPAFTHATSAVVRDTHTDVAGQWLRLSLTATAPNDYPGVTNRFTYPRAAFARISTSVTSAADGEIHQLGYAQFEKSPPGVDVEEDLVGQNLLSMEQGSYEGRVLYLPTSVTSAYLTVEDNASLLRVTDVVSCGEYALRYRYASPSPDNSYDLVRSFGSYDNVTAKRSTYAALKYTQWTPADGGTQVGSAGSPPPGPAGIGLLPTRAAMVPAQPGLRYRVQVSVATERPNFGVYCTVYAFDSDFNIIGSPMIAFPNPADIGGGDNSKGRYNALGARRWQVAWGFVQMPVGTAWAAVVPRVTTGSQTTLVFWADEHRLMLPTTQSSIAGGGSPARPWQPAKQLTVKLRANRVNYVSNPSLHNNITGYRTNSSGALTTALARNADGVSQWSCQFTITGPITVQELVDGPVSRTGIRSVTSSPALIDRLKPDTTYTASAYVRPTVESVPLTIWAHDGLEWVRGETSNIYAPAGAPWDRIKVTFTTATTHSGTLDMIVGYAANSVQYLYGPIEPGTDPAVWEATDAAPTGDWTPEGTYFQGEIVAHGGQQWVALVYHGPYLTRASMQFRVDQLMVEEDSRLLDYFDGNFPSADYMWEAGAAVVGNSRSYYYRGRTRNQYRLERALQEHIPLGGAYRILYATAP